MDRKSLGLDHNAWPTARLKGGGKMATADICEKCLRGMLRGIVRKGKRLGKISAAAFPHRVDIIT